VHRKHHAFTDVEGDPHSPALLGWVRVQFTNVGLYRKVANDPGQVARYARDLPPDGWDRAIFDRPWLGLGVGIGVLILLFGPWIGLLAAACHTGMYLGLNAAVNSITHTFGRQPHPNSATNLQWLALLTCGEGLHNNHHAAPTSANFALGRGQVDPSWPVISALSHLRLAKIRHHEVKLKEPARV
jgi:stearoyl-CoA desaturase (delta-9 desaturase)